MKSKLDINADKNELYLAEDITIENAQELKAELVNASSKCNELTVNVKDVSKADIVCLQLLCSLCRTYTLKNRQIDIHGLDSEVFAKLLSNAGLIYKRQCYFNKMITCLWSRESQ